MGVSSTTSTRGPPGSVVSVDDASSSVPAAAVASAVPLARLTSVSNSCDWRTGFVSHAATPAAHADSPRRQVLLEHCAGGGIVVHDEHAQIAQLGGWRRPGREVLAGEACVEPEGAALTGLRFDANLTAHQFGQPLRDGQAQAGPAVHACC